MLDNLLVYEIDNDACYREDIIGYLIDPINESINKHFQRFYNELLRSDCTLNNLKLIAESELKRVFNTYVNGQCCMNVDIKAQDLLQYKYKNTIIPHNYNHLIEWIDIIYHGKKLNFKPCLGNTKFLYIMWSAIEMLSGNDKYKVIEHIDNLVLYFKKESIKRREPDLIRSHYTVETIYENGNSEIVYGVDGSSLMELLKINDLDIINNIDCQGGLYMRLLGGFEGYFRNCNNLLPREKDDIVVYPKYGIKITVNMLQKNIQYSLVSIIGFFKLEEKRRLRDNSILFYDLYLGKEDNNSITGKLMYGNIGSDYDFISKFPKTNIQLSNGVIESNVLSMLKTSYANEYNRVLDAINSLDNIEIVKLIIDEDTRGSVMRFHNTKNELIWKNTKGMLKEISNINYSLDTNYDARRIISKFDLAQEEIEANLVKIIKKQNNKRINKAYNNFSIYVNCKSSLSTEDISYKLCDYFSVLCDSIKTREELYNSSKILASAVMAKLGKESPLKKIAKFIIPENKSSKIKFENNLISDIYSKINR